MRRFLVLSALLLASYSVAEVSVPPQTHAAKSQPHVARTHRRERGAAGAEPKDVEHLTVVTELIRRPLQNASTIVGAPKASSAAAPPAKGAAAQRLKVIFYFALWYVINVWYNIVNKSTLNALPLPWTVATAQLGIGSAWVALQWLLRAREAPVVSRRTAASVLPVAAFHGAGQLATVLSLGAGAVSFTHVVKALEPFFSALVSAFCLGQVFKPLVYGALVPVVLGVAVASFAEISFSWVSFAAAMFSNLMFACRAVFSKVLMGKTAPNERKMSAANLYAVVTIAAFALTVPLAAVAEAGIAGKVWQTATGGDVVASRALALSVLLSGLTHYMNNEVMYLALNNVHPITLAVGNTMKRVFIIVASLVVFKNPITPIGAAGSVIALMGVLLYSLARQRYG